MQVHPSVEKPEGPYPTYVEQDGGRMVPVVQVMVMMEMIIVIVMMMVMIVVPVVQVIYI